MASPDETRTFEKDKIEFAGVKDILNLDGVGKNV